MNLLWLLLFGLTLCADFSVFRRRRIPFRTSFFLMIFGAGWVLSSLGRISGEGSPAGSPMDHSSPALSSKGLSAPSGSLPAEKAGDPAALSRLSPGSPLHRPFSKGGAGAWLTGLGELDDLDDEMERWEMMARLTSLDTSDLKELSAAIQEEIDHGTNPQTTRTAARLRFLVLNQWSALDASAAFDHFTHLPPDQINGHMAQLIFQRFSADHPAEAMAGLSRLPEEARQSAGRGIMDQTARRDPFAALSLIPELGKYASSDPRGIVDAAVALDPLRTAAMAGPISGDAPQDNTFLRAMEKWMERDPGAAETWMQNYNGPGRTSGMTAVIAKKLQTDPAGAAAEFLSLPSPSENPYAPRVAEQLTEALIKNQGPEAALNWSRQLAESPLKDSAVFHAVSGWAAADGEAASSWLNTQTPGAGRDSAVLGLVNGIRSSDPAAAWAWALSLATDSTRTKILSDLQKDFSRQAPAAARAALEALSPAQRQAIGVAP